MVCNASPHIGTPYKRREAERQILSAHAQTNCDDLDLIERKKAHFAVFFCIRRKRLIMIIYKATHDDFNSVYDIECQAFGKDKEAKLVADLLDDPTASPRLSLLASIGGKAVGHILFTAVTLIGAKVPVTASILAPLAIIPDAQGRGVGGALIAQSLHMLKADGTELVFVLGHPGYYPRHGFQTAGHLGFEAPYPIPEEVADAWMVQELKDNTIGSTSGRVQCADTLNRPEYWRE